jgi:hypothetical protein
MNEQQAKEMLLLMAEMVMKLRGLNQKADVHTKKLEGLTHATQQGLKLVYGKQIETVAELRHLAQQERLAEIERRLASLERPNIH